MQQSRSGKNVSVGNVLNVCKVKEVVVFSDLEARLTSLASLEESKENSGVAFTVDGSRSNGAGKEGV